VTTEQDVADIEWVKSVARWMEATNKNVGKLTTIAELQSQHLSRVRTMASLTLGVVIGSAIAQAVLR
jgi:hypothetical protein